MLRPFSMFTSGRLIKQFLERTVSRRTLSNVGGKGSLRIAIIGSGPAGFYTAHQLIKQCKEVSVDIFERLPVPFGLVRFGVAPDHSEVKNVINQFTTLAQSDRCRFIGNINIGTDVNIEQLRSYYNGVVMAYGAEEDKRMKIKGEDSNGVYSARSFVSWYNGMPGYEELNPDLVSGDTAVIIGQGNVGLDVSRILLTPLEILKSTDICTHALESLRESKIKRVIMVGRRGALQVAFTIKELRNMIKLPNCCTLIQNNDMLPYKDIISDLPRPRRRLTELMMKTAASSTDGTDCDNEWELMFCRSPVEIITEGNNGRVKGIKLEVNTLEEDNKGSVRAIGTGRFESIGCSLVMRGIGYKSVNIDPLIPFNEGLGVIDNVNGRVINNGHIVNGLYCSGWVKRGPVGAILNTMNDSFETAEAIVQDTNDGKLTSNIKSDDIVEDLLKPKGLTPVLFNDWVKIDNEEKTRGQLKGKPREKIVSIAEMLHIIKSK